MNKRHSVLHGAKSAPLDLTGTDGPGLLVGHAGGDTLTGLLGPDLLIGNRGDDILIGDRAGPSGVFSTTGGNDLILAGRGNDTANGGGGDDIILGGRGNDRLVGDLGADTILGGAGNDLILGGLQPSLGGLSQGPASQNYSVDGPDLLLGGQGNDTIDGAAGNDTLIGGPGDDVLIGANGLDLLTGGPGADRFVFGRLPTFSPDTGSGPGRRDIITDFQPGQDVIDLHGHENFFLPSSQLHPLFLGTAPFAASFDLQVRYEVQDGNTILQFSAPFGVPPEGTPPEVPQFILEIELTGVHTLAASDVIL